MQRTARPGIRISGLPDSEMQYWRDAYTSEPYFEEGRHFEDYSPAYEIGWTGYHDYGGEFDTAECVMATDWTVHKGISSLSWEQARAASRAAWQRAENAREFTTDGSARPEEAIATLNELVENARNGELGFREAAEHTKTLAVNALFVRCAENWREAAAELQEQIERLGGEVEQGGSVRGRGGAPRLDSHPGVVWWSQRRDDVDGMRTGRRRRVGAVSQGAQAEPAAGNPHHGAAPVRAGPAKLRHDQVAARSRPGPRPIEATADTSGATAPPG